ncbi:MAG TPA: flagellar motor switch protein FliG [Nocardioidaceae bacterium]|jgi:flagellar motor switch protein FliG|nr:flagellar motor switch protein FliG [Nocardioidaceae bacterium]
MSLTLTSAGVRKAAILLVQIGQENAAKVMAHLRESEVEAISAEISNLDSLGGQETEAVLEEFRDIAGAHANVMRGGPAFARALLEESLGYERAEAIMNRLAASAMQLPFQFLHRADPRQLLSFISGEHPQVIAVLLAHIPSDKATLVLSGLEPEQQADVAHRIAVMDRTSPEILQRLEAVLERKMSSVLQPLDFSTVGGVDPLVAIINRSDRVTERLIVEGLQARDPELAEQIKSRMFMFEDIVMLEDRGMQLVLRQVENSDLALALKGVSDEVRTKVTSNMSERAAATLLEDLELLGPVLLRQVEEAQQKVILTIRRLEDAGEIVLRRGSDDEYVL